MFINTILPGKLTLQPTMIYSSGQMQGICVICYRNSR